MVIDHIGVVVRSLEDGIRQWEELFGYHVSSEVVVNSRQMVRVVFLSKKNSVTIKLIQPSGPASPVSLFSRRGGGLHHLCFRCDDLTTDIPLLKAKGVRFTVPPQPGEAFCNRNITFFLTDNNLNVELIDTTAKQGWTGCE